MVDCSGAEKRQHALRLGRAFNLRPVLGKTCRMSYDGYRKAASRDAADPIAVVTYNGPLRRSISLSAVCET
jgi:hypothetical protein